MTKREELEQAIQMLTNTMPNPRDYDDPHDRLGAMELYDLDWTAAIRTRARLQDMLDNMVED